MFVRNIARYVAWYSDDGLIVMENRVFFLKSCFSKTCHFQSTEKVGYTRCTETEMDSNLNVHNTLRCTSLRNACNWTHIFISYVSCQKSAWQYSMVLGTKCPL
jgi:hypothetical protein